MSIHQIMDRLNLDVQQLQLKLNMAEDAFMDIYDHSKEEHSSRIAERMLKELGVALDDKSYSLEKALGKAEYEEDR